MQFSNHKTWRYLVFLCQASFHYFVRVKYSYKELPELSIRVLRLAGFLVFDPRYEKKSGSVRTDKKNLPLIFRFNMSFDKNTDFFAI